MKKHVIAAASLALLASSAAFAQQANDGPWLVRVRAVQLQSANSDSTGLGLSINNKVLPEVDFSYFFNKQWAAELILTVPQSQDLSANGAKIGTLKHLPPTLTAQYHFDAAGFSPYLGAGVNYTRFSDVNILNGAANIGRDSFGAAVQAGVDVPLSGNMSLNLDLKKVYLGTKVYVGAANVGNFKVDPVLIGLGLGWRF